MNAGPMFPGELLGSRPETWRGQWLRVKAPEAVTRHFTSPGQYCLMGIGDAVAPFVIADASEPGVLAFYLQRPGVVAERLMALAPGGAVTLSPPQGPGFPVQTALDEGGPVVALTNGSGLSGVREALFQLVAAGVPTTLYQSCYEPGDFPMLSDLTLLQAQGLTVHLLTTGEAHGWRGRRGMVQEALFEDAAQGFDLTTARYLLCGVPEMQAEVTRQLLDAGVAADRVHANY